jgi:DNA-directed RNA polymerase subunit K/omega
MLVELPPEVVDPVTIAEMEFAQGVIPITVRRGGETPAGGVALRL